MTTTTTAEMTGPRYRNGDAVIYTGTVWQYSGKPMEVEVVYTGGTEPRYDLLDPIWRARVRRVRERHIHPDD